MNTQIKTIRAINKRLPAAGADLRTQGRPEADKTLRVAGL